MTPFHRLTGRAAPLLEDGIDTDVIFPARYLLLLDIAGLRRHAFHDRRYTPEGAERTDFVLNRPELRDAPILLAGQNFGSGSSREQAVWCLADFGIRCIIAVSFGDIFAANCVNNGVLPIVLPRETISALAETAAELAIDLEAQTITPVDGAPICFDIAPQAREALLRGRDATRTILASQGEAILAFEARHRTAQPWLFAITGD
jgi:3-isopropylmalate/(R)-2-methylmalate dehydratase small subunit